MISLMRGYNQYGNQIAVDALSGQGPVATSFGAVRNATGVMLTPAK